MNLKVNWDGLGIITSLLCAVHCALLPVLLTSLPLFGVNIIHNLLFEWGMIAIAAAVGAYSLYHGFIKHHQQWLPAILFAVGILFLITKQLFHQYEIWLLIPAVLLIVTAHYQNYRLCHLSKCSSPHHKH
jgi:hypothetical protein